MPCRRCPLRLLLRRWSLPSGARVPRPLPPDDFLPPPPSATGRSGTRSKIRKTLGEQSAASASPAFLSKSISSPADDNATLATGTSLPDLTSVRAFFAKEELVESAVSHDVDNSIDANSAYRDMAKIVFGAGVPEPSTPGEELQCKMEPRDEPQPPAGPLDPGLDASVSSPERARTPQFSDKIWDLDAMQWARCEICGNNGNLTTFSDLLGGPCHRLCADRLFKNQLLASAPRQSVPAGSAFKPRIIHLFGGPKKLMYISPGFWKPAASRLSMLTTSVTRFLVTLWLRRTLTGSANSFAMTILSVYGSGCPASTDPVPGTGPEAPLP